MMHMHSWGLYFNTFFMFIFLPWRWQHFGLNLFRQWRTRLKIPFLFRFTCRYNRSQNHYIESILLHLPLLIIILLHDLLKNIPSLHSRDEKALKKYIPLTNDVTTNVFSTIKKTFSWLLLWFIKVTSWHTDEV